MQTHLVIVTNGYFNKMFHKSLIKFHKVEIVSFVFIPVAI